MEQSKKSLYLTSVAVFVVGIGFGFFVDRYCFPKIKIMRATKIFGLADNQVLKNWPIKDSKQMVSFLHIDGFNIVAPVPNENNIIMITKNDLWLGVYNGTNDIMHMDKNGNYYSLTEWDIDNKGINDAVMYGTINDKDNLNGMVIDLDRDGQADIKVVYGHDNNGKVYIKEQYDWVDGKFYKLEKINGKSMINVLGKYHLVKKINRNIKIID